MIEEIQALMPILERISDGALLAFLIYMMTKVIATVVWPIVFCVIALRLAQPVLQVLVGGKRGPSDLDIYNLNYKGANVTTYIGDLDTLVGFFKWLGKEGSYGYSHASDLKDVMKQVKGQAQ